MGKVLIEEENLTNIANSIRSKTGSTELMTPSEMAGNVEQIEGVGDYFTTEFENGRGITQTQETSWYKSILKLPPLSFNGTTCSAMFYYCPAQTIDLSNFNTSNVTNMNRMFLSCSKLTSLDLSKFDTSNVENMGSMFSGCSNLTSLDLSKFDTSNVTTMESMFSGCSKLTSLDLSKFNTSNVTNMNGMFSNLKLTTLNLSNFNTSNVTTMANMFNNCSALTTLNLSNFNTSNVTTVGNMFFVCSNLTDVNLSSFDFSKVTYTDNLFSNCTNLTNLTFGTNLGKGYIQNTEQYTYYRLVLTSCTKLTHDSLMSVINGLYDLNLTYDVANGGTLYTQSLVLGATNIAKLTEEEIAIATAKGWTVS